MTRKGRRLALIGAVVGMLGLAAGLMMFAFRDNIVFFYGPTELAQKRPGPGARLRIGGLVKEGSVKKLDGQRIDFVVTDTKADVAVTYVGQVPDLFREGQGVVAEGTLVSPGNFRADTVLAKHDEKYMPREVADALKKEGVWNEGGQAAAGKAGKP
jgi:cytochrome c-type biogenesis protein CcmE